jgi:hypothetical protein
VLHDITDCMIKAAGRLYTSDWFKGWRLSDEALSSVRDKYPDFDEPSCLIKTVAINSLYSTQIYAVVHVAKHISRVMRGKRPDDQLIETLADAGNGRKNVSFASKFAHFFIAEHFLIFDSAALRAIRFHLGETNAQSSYSAYCAELKRCAPNGAYNKSFDQYLWLTGSWMNWKTHKDVNAETRVLFDAYPDDLHDMLPEALRGKRPSSNVTKSARRSPRDERLSMQDDARPLREIAAEIEGDWKVINNQAARKALDLMKSMGSITAPFYLDDHGFGVVGSFIEHSRGWRGDVARRVKKELRTMCGHLKP